MKALTEVFTGLRPSGDLTIANYLGAIKPMIDLQDKDVLIFVADLHALTDQEAKTAAEHRKEMVVDYLALGIDPDKADIFIQSDIKDEILYLNFFLSRHISLAEIMRVPALKDKLKDPKHPERASFLLAGYPIMMAADILLQAAKTVPVGEDQMSHIEVTRLLARRFNKKYGDILVEPKAQVVKPLRVLSLTGNGKMSKSQPNGAILLDEDPKKTVAKIKKAATAVEGEMNDVLESHFVIAESLASDDQKKQLEDIKTRNTAKEKVMGQFKVLLADIVSTFVSDFQAKKKELLEDPDRIEQILAKGKQRAQDNARQVISEIERALKF